MEVLPTIFTDYTATNLVIQQQDHINNKITIRTGLDGDVGLDRGTLIQLVEFDSGRVIEQESHRNR